VIPNWSNLDLVSSLLEKALRRQQYILGHIAVHQTTSVRSKGGDGVLATFQADVKVKFPEPKAIQTQLSESSVAIYNWARF